MTTLPSFFASARSLASWATAADAKNSERTIRSETLQAVPQLKDKGI